MIHGSQDIENLRKAFIKTMKAKHDTVEGRADTLDTLSVQIKRNILTEIKDLGSTEIPQDLTKQIVDRFRNEFEAVILAIENRKN